MRHLALTCLLMICAGSPVAAQPFTKRYLMALHTCTTDCANPQTHTARIVESDDGQQWTPVPNVPTINASVPDLLIRGDKLYLYSPGRLMRYNRTTNTWQASVNVTIRDTQNQMVPFVDPSPTLDEQGRIVLFFLRGNIGQGDPASCNPYPCIKQFGSAVEVAGSDGAEFVLQTGWRAEINLTAGVLADPDISFDGRRYVLLISAGPNTLAYTATQLHGAYQPVAGLTNALLTNGGGVPSSYFDAATQQYWVFTHSDIQGRTVIRRAIQSTLERALTPNQFETIITAERFGLNATASAASPGFTVNTWLPNAASSNVSAASFRRDPFAAEMICAAFGSDLAKVALSAASTPLPNTLAGTTLKLKDNAGSERAAPLFFVSPTQINFLLPTGTVNGAATLTITNADGLVSTSALAISTVAPGLFAANANGQGVAAALALRVRADGTQQYEPIARFDTAQQRYVAVPIEVGPEGEQVFLVLFGTGWRQRSTLANVTVKLGGVDAEVLFAGAVNDLAGLDQLNVRLPRTLAGRGEIEIALTVDGQAANPVRAAIR